MSSFAARAGELPADRPLMIVCHLGNRSSAVAGFLLRSGRPDVVNVAGGMDAWEKSGLPVRRGTLEAGEGDLPG
jgi:rhodanese-related sulfurtransferase